MDIRKFKDTIIPKYNGEFYKKMDFQIVDESVCKYQDKEVKAIRFEKFINRL